MGENDDITAGCPCACCPKYQELIDWAEYLEEIAVRIERDEWYYLTVKADIVENGWESEFARIGISGYRDPTVPNQNQAALIQHFEGTEPEVIFAEDLTPAVLNNAVARPGLVSVIRERAGYARALGERGLEYCSGNPDYVGQDEEDPVLDYFCTLDPDKATDEVWGELFKIGYIDFATYQDVGYEVLSARWARAELIASVASLIFVWRGALLSLAKSSARGLVRLTRAQAQRLVNLGRRQTPRRVEPRARPRRGSVNYGNLAARADSEAGLAQQAFMGIGFYKPYAQMSPSMKKAFQHAYTRYVRKHQQSGLSSPLPNWSQTRAEELRQLFNAEVGQIRNSAHSVTVTYKPYGQAGSGQPAISSEVTHFQATIRGREYYYYELRDIGFFVSAGPL